MVFFSLIGVFLTDSFGKNLQLIDGKYVNKRIPLFIHQTSQK